MLAAALLAFAVSSTQAQNIREDHRILAAKITDPELRAVTEQVLQRKNHYYTQEALRNLDKKGENFTLMRVEVTGVMSNDDTGEYDKNLFEEQIKPSFSALENMTAVERARYKFKRFIDPAHTAELVGDSVEYSNAARGVTTVNAQKKLAAYKDAEINELVAHSWGYELVYAAILNGDIRPPKKLIVVGVPDNDQKKWALLAAWTGTEVHWARAENDIVRNAQDRAAQIGLDAGASVDFKAKWDAVCASGIPNNRTCHPHERKSKKVIIEKIGKIPGMLGHARTEYYDVLENNGVLKYSHQQLRSAMIESYENETERVRKNALEEALVEARGLVAEAHAQAQRARRDHDERLRKAMLDIAERACTTPEKLDQAELDSLADPYDQDFVNIVPSGLTDCVSWVYRGLGRGVDLMRIRKLANSFGEPVKANPAPQAPALNWISEKNFLAMLPGVKNFALAACRAPGQASIPDDVARPYNAIRFNATEDDREVVRLSVGLGACEIRLFYRLIELIRGGYGPRIDTRWVIGAVHAYTPAPSYNDPTPPRYTPPPSSGDPCRDNGNVRCP
jgi:hypothetical protein